MAKPEQESRKAAAQVNDPKCCLNFMDASSVFMNQAKKNKDASSLSQWEKHAKYRICEIDDE